MTDLFSMAAAMMNDAGNYDSRKIARDTINGVDVSTCYTSDMGYETALLDNAGTHPVERYANKKDAKEGHKKWMKFAASKKTKIIELGYGELAEDKEITLKRGKNE